MMKLVTYQPAGAGPQLGVLVANEMVVNLHLASGGRLPNDMRAFLELGEPALELARAIAAQGAGPGAVPLASVKLLAPIPNPSKVVAIGLNYMDHVRESGGKVPTLATMFTKYPSSIIGPGDEIHWDPALTNKVDYEAELAVVIGKRASKVKEEDAYDYIVGYTNCHDVSARDLQLEKGDQWIMGKSLDTFCPLGPYLVTKDEIADPHNLAIKCIVNGQALQDSNTRELIFKIPYLIAYLSRGITLLPGDVITTGTPDGVGAFRKPPVFLKHGDVVTVEVEGLGQLTNPCIEERSA
ncbi:MAG TPA: fumarylacetoacetate hydrolase family protein [Caldilineaceae bacterium]|nr:fumarylacetoacetate hydrolase family protein [Caldilineaceae bacterium]